MHYLILNEPIIINNPDKLFKNAVIEELHDSTVEEEGITKLLIMWCTIHTISITNYVVCNTHNINNKLCGVQYTQYQ